MISMPANITLSPVRDWAAVGTAWRELERQALPSFFQSWTWVGCLAEERFFDPVLLRVERGGRTVGLALLNRMRGRLGGERLLLNESGNPTLDTVYIEHNGVLLAPDAGDLVPDCLHAMLTCPVASDRAYAPWQWSRQLRLAGVDAAHLAAAQQVGRVRLARESAAPFVDFMNLPAGSDRYLASLSANTRYQIRRSNRSFARLGELELREATLLDEALAFLEALAALHQATWSARGMPGAFGNSAFMQFHRALVVRALPRGEVVLQRVAAGRQILGYLYNFRLHGRVVAYQSGFDYAAAATLDGSHAKPGLTCHYAAILRAQSEGANVYDFLAGPDRYKRSLTRAAQPLYWLDVAPRISGLGRRVTSMPYVPAAQEIVPERNVLVLGDDTRAFLTIVRSLGRRGINVHAAPANFRSPALESRYIRVIHELPPWIGDGTEWLSAMQALLRDTAFDLVIPCTETTLLPLQHHRAELATMAPLAIPDDRAITVLFDKYETRQLARRLGISVAAGRLLRPDDHAKVVLAEFGLPIVLKPRSSYSLGALASRGKVQVVREPAFLDQLLSRTAADETILERFFPGQGVGISLLASRGRVLQAFEHHRVHEIAGASFYRVSAPLSQDMASACEAIVASLSYTGLAMFEFKRNTQGEWILLEINARPWGSMPLPVALGVDFPYWWYRLLTSNEESVPFTYRAGVYGRNLFPDLLAAKAEAEELRLRRTALIGFATRRAVELLRPLVRREVHDVLVRDDPRPAVIELAAVAVAVRERVGRVMPAASARRRRRARRQIIQVLRRGARNPVVLFVCQGNICRSPFAEALFRARLDQCPIIVRSAGMMPQSGRAVPDLGLQAAATYGIDLSAHRSVWLARDAVAAASVILVFDDTNRAAVLDRYPRIKAPVVNFGDLTEAGSISDPIDGDLTQFHRVYDRIAEAVAALASLMYGALANQHENGRKNPGKRPVGRRV
jgi:protein-tyrosine-phosphatase/predicted ATP-grasp superfamily ATP-dependent carboligase